VLTEQKHGKSRTTWPRLVELMLGDGKVCSDFNFGHSITAHYANTTKSADKIRPTKTRPSADLPFVHYIPQRNAGV
jgi:hypothetical protein